MELLGETLLQAQKFERSIGYCVGLAFSDRTIFRGSDIPEIEVEAARVTLGKFVARLRERQALPEDLELKLKSVLVRRNRMVHGILDSSEFDLESSGGCSELAMFLMNLSVDMTHLDFVFFGFVRNFAELIGVPKERLILTPAMDEIIEAYGYQLLRRDA